VTLEKGQRLGPYEIEAPAGKGGMGEVYRARDTRLDRIVAIKVLPSHSTMNSDTRARFDREARTISSLNHPNVCTLHDVGHENGVDFLVMEFLEGEPLDERLKRGKFETEEALEAGAQIAGALDAAHRKGLVHRDLKPSNIFLTKNGAKLLDFGLAKLQAEAVTGMDDETRTTPVTGAGAIVGTLQYMSPEQLEGKEADARSDIFAFGATLYEMLTGARAFSGQSKASLIGSIMKEEPRAISEIQPTSPPALDRLIKKCLQKDPDDRWQSAKDLKDELDWIASAGSQAGIAAPVTRKRRFRLRLGWILAAVFALIAALFGGQRLMQETSSPPMIRATITLPASAGQCEWPQISPDGRYLAFLAYDSTEVSRIWLRPMHSDQAYPLPGTKNAYHPFWSPDSRYLAYFEAGHGIRPLKKVPIAGGSPQVICKANGYHGAWGSQDVILFEASFQDGTPLYKVSALGGTATPATVLDTANAEIDHFYPQFLPDGRHFIWMTQTTRHSWPVKEIRLGNLDDLESRAVGTAHSNTLYLPPGYLMYEEDGRLIARRFDLQSGRLTGGTLELAESVSLAAGQTSSWESVWINASVSKSGTVVWGKESRPSTFHLAWADRNGSVVDTLGKTGEGELIPTRWHTFECVLSPDKQYLAYVLQRLGSRSRLIEILDLDRKASSRLTSGDAMEWCPRWSPDSRSIVYTEFKENNSRLVARGVNDLTPAPLLETDSTSPRCHNWSSDGRLWCGEYFTASLTLQNPRIFSFDIIDPSRLRTEYIFSDFVYMVDISPDCRYFIGADGLHDKWYVHDMKGGQQRWLLPGPSYWGLSDNEMFCIKDGYVMSLPLDLSNGFAYGEPEPLFPLQERAISLRASDGQRFLLALPAEPEEHTRNEFQVFQNWQTELESRK
jgi:serine/threonine protein kinase